LKPGRRRRQALAQEGAEDQEVRQYRFLLRTAPADALEAAHVEGLSAVGSEIREVVLRTVQSELVAGSHLQPDDAVPLAHLVTLGERRSPGVLTRAMPTPTLNVLARAVIGAEAAFGLFGGYADWDGRDPERPLERDDSEYGESWHSDQLHADDTAVWRAGSGSGWLPPSPRSSRHG
jgi:hypothetical protein